MGEGTTVSRIAIAAVLVCNALAVGPPGAYMFVLACAAGTGVASEHLSPWRVGLLVFAGGAFAWLVHMSGSLTGVRGPEKAAVAAAAQAVARFVDAVGSSSEGSARHRAATALAQSWNVLVTFSRSTQDRRGRRTGYGPSTVNCMYVTLR